MRNFTGEHLHVIENVGCRCKICKGSIFKSKKRQDVDVIVHDRQAEKYLQVRRKVSCRYVSQPKRASTTANIKGLQIHQLPKEHLHKQINREYRYIRYQKSKSLIAPSISITIHLKEKKKTMQSSELESGLPDEAEQECIVFSCLGLS